MSLSAELYCDGASRGNPGPAGAGALLKEKGTGKVLAALSAPLGRATNNEAEYAALLLGLEEAKRQGVSQLAIHADSQLVIRQILGQYKVKHPEMRIRHAQALSLLAGFPSWTATHIPREANADADRLANRALDGPAA